MFGYALAMFSFRPRRPALTAPVLLAVLLTAAAGVQAEPFVPSGDDTALESRYDGASPEFEALRGKARELARRPEDAAAAAEVARGFLRLARRDADSRLAGYAQAALRPWWTAHEPPGELLFLRASLRQTLHQFDPALADLQTYLARPRLLPRERAQALLTRSTVLTVLGRFQEAASDCAALPDAPDRAVRLLCAAQAQAGGSGAPRTLRVLALYFRQGGFASDPALRRWGDLILGELAARQGASALAADAFQAALREDAGDSYSLAAYADFLLDQDRAAEVRDLLSDRLQADGLLLRHAIALRRLGDARAAQEADMLAARYAAARARGDHTHKREEARYLLALRADSAAALALAQQNWEVQREPADLRILAECAEAARDDRTRQQVRDWLRQTGLVDLASQSVRTLQPKA